MDTQSQTQIKYKFKDLKTHGTQEWLFGSQKKYRQVFDVEAIKYIYVELSFYNLMFDKEDWSITVDFKAYDSANAVLCDKQVTQTISKADNVGYIRYSWGTPDAGKYWTKGVYRWEAWINGALYATKYFYMIGEGEVTPVSNPYFSLKTLKLYEGPVGDVDYGKRKYCKTFDANKTRYIFFELEGDNLLNGKVDWQGEFFFRIRNSVGEIIANIIDFYTYKSDNNLIRFSRGWGSGDVGNWYQGDYILDVVLLEHVLGTVQFKVADYEEEDAEAGKFIGPGEGLISTAKQVQEPRKELSEAEIMKEIDEMIGLQTIKQSIKDKYGYLKFLKYRKEKGIDDVSERIGLHAVFTGNPGTGKTKTALLLGKIYFNLGLLSKGHVHEVDRADLVAGFIGQTAPLAKEAIKKAKGGILFIDEAYSLHREDSDRDFGREAVEVILKEMSDGDGDLAVIVAGYPDEMQSFLESNPGLKSRFNSYFQFPDYTPQELLDIGKLEAKDLDIQIAPDAEELLHKKLIEAYRDRDRMFGNARFVKSIVGEAKMNLGLRVVSGRTSFEGVEDFELSTVTIEDIKEIFRRKQAKGIDIPPDEELLRDAQYELNSLVGLQNIKNDIHEMTKLVRYYRETGKDVTRSFSLHTIFTGNPGTGKTTIARIMARIFRALGVLERGHLVEVDREALVAGYIGQTATKTAAKIDEAMGGVLFIDEAYSLMGSTDSDFGKEAIEIILKRMEDNRGQFVVICAGYTEEMESFLKMNPGLKSRFDRKFYFEDYNEDDLFAIANIMVRSQELEFDAETAEHMRKHIKALCSFRDKFFGNAREIRKSISEAVKNQNLRLAEMPKTKRTKEMMKTITFKDVEELTTEIKKEKPGMGF
jgi:SpoVK/Ycf46/Vps4 family AAA+-type ATPase